MDISLFLKALDGKPKEGKDKEMDMNMLEVQMILGEFFSGKRKPILTYETPDQSPLVEPCHREDAYRLRVQWITKMDLPGSLNFPMGLPHFTDWFWALYLGNYDAFMEIVSSKSKPELTKLLKRRESCLHLNAIFIPVLGAQVFYTEKELEAMRRGGEVERKYIQILRELIVLGADVNDRDILGCTPLFHCIATDKMNDLTFSIGEFLLQQGADPNVYNRLGESLLMDSLTENENLEILELLIKYKADPFLKWEILKDDKQKCAMDMSVTKPKTVQIMQQGVRNVNQQARRSAKERGEFKTCHKCKKHAEKRCTGCFLTWYCTRDCQVADWNMHAQECKEIRADYKEVNLFQAKEANAVVYMPDGCANELGFVFNPKVSQFVVEIQLPVEQADSDWLLCIDKEEDVVYMISLQSIIGAKLRQAIQDYNRSGNRKGYFYSIVENGRHYINPTILPPETWSKFRQYAFCQHGGLAY